MPFFVIPFLMGDLFLQQFANLPAYSTLLAVFVASMVIIFLPLQRTHKLMFLGFLSGFSYTAYDAHHQLRWSLPITLENKPIMVIGHVSQLPVVTSQQTIFRLSVTHINDQVLEASNTIKLSWRHPTKRFHVGDQLQLLVRLKRVHGLQNPGGFDGDAWSYQQRIRAAGYVVNNHANRVLSHASDMKPFLQFRENIYIALSKHLPTSDTAHWLLALILGERINVPPEHWEVLRRTGTNHLMAIGGLHVGMVAGLVHYGFDRAWRCFPGLLMRIPAQFAALTGGLVAAIAYGSLAGFAIPAKRACLMLSVYAFITLKKQRLSAWHAWSLALLLVLIVNPHDVLSDSFWLSFVTIALIIYGMKGRLSPKGLWWRFGRVQWVIGVGLIPLTIFFFQECSLISFIANSIAIPWLGCFILPVCLLSVMGFMISTKLATLLLSLADVTLAGLWQVLTFLAHVELSSLHLAFHSMLCFVLCVVGVMVLLMPSGAAGRWLGLLWLLPVMLIQHANLKEGEFMFTLLDVGQGLSSVIQTREHALVFDTGLKLSEDHDMGKMVVLPFLRQQGISKLDKLIISHADNDHRGGAGAILDAMSVSVIDSSVPNLFLSKASYCLAGMQWQWDGVTFTFLHPRPSTLNVGNNSSCVLRVDNGVYSVLLTGDIEKDAERLLLERIKHMRATILVAPHHGSKTSSHAAFVQAIRPQYVLYANGYLNKYHFPHPSTRRAYAEIGAIQYETAVTGAITFLLKNKPETLKPILHRQEFDRYWRHDRNG